MSFSKEVEHSLTKRYKKSIRRPFIQAIKKYEMVNEGDSIAVCISGGKDSMLLAKLMQMLKAHSDVPFSLRFISMDPGYAPANAALIQENAKKLEIPLEPFESPIFSITDTIEKNPCYLCARMRRGYLYSKAKELGCNKIALGHHYSDVIETTLMAMLYGAQLQGMMPKLHSTNFPGMELIRPMYMVHEDDIKDWRDYNGLKFLQCACALTERIHAEDPAVSKRQATKQLIAKLKQDNPLIESNIFNAIHNLHLDTFPEYKAGGIRHTFLEKYDD